MTQSRRVSTTSCAARPKTRRPARAHGVRRWSWPSGSPCSPPASSPTSRSASRARCCSWPAAWAGSARSCRTSSTRRCRSSHCRSSRPRSREKVARLDLGEVRHRARLPLEIHPVSSGVKGGLAGSVAMAVLAILYGSHAGQHLVSRSTSSPPAPPRAWPRLSPEALQAFSADGLLLGIVIHLLHLGHGGPALRRDAADVPAAADPARRRHRAAAVDGPPALDARDRRTRPWTACIDWRVVHRRRRSPSASWPGLVVTRTAMVRTLAVRVASRCAPASLGSGTARRRRGRRSRRWRGRATRVRRCWPRSLCVGCDCAARPARSPEHREVRPDEWRGLRASSTPRTARAATARRARATPLSRLANPVYLADRRRRRPAARHRRAASPGTQMPAFARSAGGMLTDEQVEILVQGIRAWARPEALAGRGRRRRTRRRPAATPAAGRAGLRRRLRVLSRRRRDGRAEGGLDRGRLVPRRS